MPGIGEAIDSASAYLASHPDEAVYTDSLVIATLEEGLRVRVAGPAGESIVTDMPTSVGGTAGAPSSEWFLRAAEATCVATRPTMRAAQLGISLTDLEVTVDAVSDDRGILGVDPAIAAGPIPGRVAIRLAANDATAEDLDTLVRWAVDHCPVVDAVRRSVPVVVEVETGEQRRAADHHVTFAAGAGTVSSTGISWRSTLADSSEVGHGRAHTRESHLHPGHRAARNRARQAAGDRSGPRPGDARIPSRDGRHRRGFDVEGGCRCGR